MVRNCHCVSHWKRHSPDDTSTTSRQSTVSSVTVSVLRHRQRTTPSTREHAPPRKRSSAQGGTRSEVAAAASVSVATVSRALRGLDNVAHSTRQKVELAAHPGRHRKKNAYKARRRAAQSSSSSGDGRLLFRFFVVMVVFFMSLTISSIYNFLSFFFVVWVPIMK